MAFNHKSAIGNRKSEMDLVLLSHGGGGRRTQQLIRDLILEHLGNPILDRLDDGACLDVPERDLVFTTDSYVVSPIFFPGGDIGKLAVCGTINDLAMQGAAPRYLSLALILEEGMALTDLERVIQSVARMVRETGVMVVTGDTKVVERGKGNGVFINTAGIGIRYPGVDTHVANARSGDAVILTGTMGDHGVAVMSRREGLNLETDVVSDVAPLWGMIEPLLREIPGIHSLRDPTRGGVAAALGDMATAAKVGIRIHERALPIRPGVQGACKLLGLDVLNVANEGKALVICAQAQADRALRILRAHPLGRKAAVIGTVTAETAGMVLLETAFGGERIVEVPLGEDLPRIC
ncbi:MAG: hydrogenase expression/formation protein HypE [Kiritimatiellae bacterium]|nr:hydrogenase expression/formation protein HypE [Kiritimatiellia bacterium]